MDLKLFPRQEPLGGGAKERDTQMGVARERGNLFLTGVDLAKIVENAVKIICAL